MYKRSIIDVILDAYEALPWFVRPFVWLTAYLVAMAFFFACLLLPVCLACVYDSYYPALLYIVLIPAALFIAAALNHP